jgi:hypothetical protein
MAVGGKITTIQQRTRLRWRMLSGRVLVRRVLIWGILEWHALNALTVLPPGDELCQQANGDQKTRTSALHICFPPQQSCWRLALIAVLQKLARHGACLARKMLT